MAVRVRDVEGGRRERGGRGEEGEGREGGGGEEGEQAKIIDQLNWHMYIITA